MKQLELHVASDKPTKAERCRCGAVAERLIHNVPICGKCVGPYIGFGVVPKKTTVKQAEKTK